MIPPTRQLHFNSCIDWLDLAWRLPAAQPPRLFDISQLQERAQLAERGLMDALFIADFYTYRAGFSMEPLTLLSALAPLTENIGLIASVSTTYNQPAHLARMFASLDFLSQGRVGWNMVTTAIDSVAANYSKAQHLEHDSRYARAHKCIDAVTQCWRQRAGGNTPLPPINEHASPVVDDEFALNGHLRIPRSPQGEPVRMQAGSSQAGRDFAARWAEIVFTAQPLLSVAEEFYADIHARAQHYGRPAEAIKILPGLMPILATTESQANALLAQQLAQSEGRPSRVESLLGVDFSSLAQDEPIPDAWLPQYATTNGMRGRAELLMDIIRRHRLTPRQAQRLQAHHAFAGTPQQMADLITTWFTRRACDGFTLMWPSLDANILFVEQVVPELQRRGLYRTHYHGKTLRDHFDLPVPGQSGYNTGAR